MATIVIRSFAKELITETGCFEWSVVRGHRDPSGELFMHTKLITKTRARQLIEKLGLVESYSMPEGEIYDTPAGEFKALFPAGIKNKREREIIEHTDNV